MHTSGREVSRSSGAHYASTSAHGGMLRCLGARLGRHGAVAARVGLHVHDGPQHDDRAEHERNDAEQRQRADRQRGSRARGAAVPAARLRVEPACAEDSLASRWACSTEHSEASFADARPQRVYADRATCQAAHGSQLNRRAACLGAQKAAKDEMSKVIA